MLTLASHIGLTSDDKLIQRVDQQWQYFFVTLVPYIEGVFLPYQQMAQRVNAIGASFTLLSIRTIAMVNFLEQIVYVFARRLEVCLVHLFEDPNMVGTQVACMPRIFQMLSLLKLATRQIRTDMACLPSTQASLPDLVQALDRLVELVKAHWLPYRQKASARKRSFNTPQGAHEDGSHGLAVLF